MYDMFIIGGGVNGTSVCRDAAGRNLKVILCEKDDLATYTSSASTKLIHGGLRYLEYYEFRLVKEALAEREIILNSAPHITWPLRFVLPHTKDQRPRWMLRAGLFLYDNLAKRNFLPKTQSVKLNKHKVGEDLLDDYKNAFIYSDGWVMDARIVLLNALDAMEKGADVRTRTEVIKTTRHDDYWTVTVKDQLTGEVSDIDARCLVNASGPWVSKLLQSDVIDFKTKESVRLVKGSHIVVPKIYEHDHCYIFQNDDGRIVFAIPYENNFTLIGTTDIDHGDKDPSEAKCSEQERQYLCDVVNKYFKKKISPTDVVYDYAGVRPLYDDGASKAQAATRDFVLSLDAPNDNANGAILNIFGGKITAARELGEKVMHKLAPLFNIDARGWTEGQKLPGGDLGKSFDDWIADIYKQYEYLDESLLYRYGRHYGTWIHKLLKDVQSKEDLGEHLGDDCFTAELNYLKQYELCKTAEDMLWRRTKMGLHWSKETQNNVQNWFAR